MYFLIYVYMKGIPSTLVYICVYKSLVLDLRSTTEVSRNTDLSQPVAPVFPDRPCHGLQEATGFKTKNQHGKTKPKCSAILLGQRFTYTFSFYINFGVHQDRYKTPKRWQNCQRWSSKLRAVSILQESQYQGVEATGLQQTLSWNELSQMDFLLKDGRMIKVGWVGWVYVEMTTSDQKNRKFSNWVGENLGELCQEKGLESALLKLAAWEPKVKMNHHQLWREATVFTKTWRLFLANGCLVQSVVNINLWAPHPLCGLMFFDNIRHNM